MRRLSLIVMIAVVLAACSSASGSTGTAFSPAQAGPTVALSLEEAQQTAGDFLNAWVAGNYDAMYKLLHIKSQGTISQANFTAIYTEVADKLTLLPSGVGYRFTNALQSGEAAQLAYDVTFKTRLFDTVSDPGRVLSLETTPAGWRVAWSPGDVFAEMRDGATIDLVTTAPNRGNIYDRNGEVLADQNSRQVTVSLLTQKYPTNDPDACFAQLAAIFPARTAAALKKLYSQFTGHPQAYVIGTLNNTAFLVQKPALDRVCTLDYKSEAARDYPQGGLAPHVVGYVGRIPAEQENEWLAKGYAPDALIGIDGIEAAWESTLAGRGASTLILRARGQIVRTLAQSAPIPPQSVYLTLNSKFQLAVQNSLKEAYSSTTAYFSGSKGGAVVVMNVHTGEILAIASYPDFDVNAFNPNTSLPNAQELITQWTKDPRKPTFNRATRGQYPLGSVFKIVTMAAAADSGKIGLNTPITCTGVWDGAALGDRFRTDWIHNQGPGQHGTINMKQALTGSCDIYFWHVGWTLNSADPTLLPRYAKQLGFGAPTGIKDVRESSGQVPDPTNYPATEGKNWTGSDALDFAIGQGTLLVTPLQVARMISGIANGGTLYQPLLVQQVGFPNQPTYVAKPVVNGNMNIKPEVLAAIRDSMCNVTTDRTLGTATFVFHEFDFKSAVVCGKTGTAESGQLNPHAWFAAFAGRTADTPEIAVVAVIENSYEGSYVAAPIVRRIIELYYGLTPYPWPAWYGSQTFAPVNGGD